MQNAISVINDVIKNTIQLLDSEQEILQDWSFGQVKYKILSQSEGKIYVNVPIEPVINLSKQYEGGISVKFYLDESAKSENIKRIKYSRIFFNKLHLEYPLEGRIGIDISRHSELIEEIHKRINQINKTTRALKKIQTKMDNIPLIQHMFIRKPLKKPNYHKQKNFIDKRIGNIELDKKQQSFLSMVVNEKSPIYICVGVPGSGKTTTAITLLKNLTKEGKKCLVLSDSNASIDRIIRELIEREELSISILRIKGSNSVISPISKDFEVDNLSKKFLNKLIEPLSNHYETSKTLKGELSSLQENWLSRLLEKEKDLPLWYLQCFDAVFATLNLAKGFPLASLNDKVILPEPFDYIIIDKAENIALIDFLQIVHLGNHIVLFGDPKQKKDTAYYIYLTHTLKRILSKNIIYSNEELVEIYKSYKKYNRRLEKEQSNSFHLIEKKYHKFSKLINKREREVEKRLNYNVIEFLLKHFKGHKHISLDKVYRNRCISELLQKINKETKEKRLRKYCSQTKIKIIFKKELKEISRPIFLIDTKRIKALKNEVKQGKKNLSSKTNPMEGEIVCKLLRHMEIEGDEINKPHIAIISPYRAQVDEVLYPKIAKEMKIQLEKGYKHEFHTKKMFMTIETFDSFSNSECDILIITFCVYSKKDLTKFITNKNRLLSAISRSRYLCIFVCNEEILKELNKVNNGILKDVLEFINAEGAFIELNYNFIAQS